MSTTPSLVEATLNLHVSTDLLAYPDDPDSPPAFDGIARDAADLLDAGTYTVTVGYAGDDDACPGTLTIERHGAVEVTTLTLGAAPERRLAALASILTSWHDFDNGAIDDVEYDAVNTHARFVLGPAAAEALSTLTVRERWASSDGVRAVTDGTLVKVLARVDAVAAGEA